MCLVLVNGSRAFVPIAVGVSKVGVVSIGVVSLHLIFIFIQTPLVAVSPLKRGVSLWFTKIKRRHA